MVRNTAWLPSRRKKGKNRMSDKEKLIKTTKTAVLSYLQYISDQSRESFQVLDAAMIALYDLLNTEMQPEDAYEFSSEALKTMLGSDHETEKTQSNLLPNKSTGTGELN